MSEQSKNILKVSVENLVEATAFLASAASCAYRAKDYTLVTRIEKVREEVIAITQETQSRLAKEYG